MTLFIVRLYSEVHCIPELNNLLHINSSIPIQSPMYLIIVVHDETFILLHAIMNIAI